MKKSLQQFIKEIIKEQLLRESQSSTTVIMSSDPEKLAAALKDKDSITVEAEYGSITVNGSIATLAHHGKNSGNKCPCAYENGFAPSVEVIGVSHLDLDSIGGVAAALGIKPESDTFWKLAEFVDLNGAHKIQNAKASKEDISRLNAWWAWSESHKLYPPNDGSVIDCTAQVNEAIDAITRILNDDEEMLVTDEMIKLKEDELEKNSYVATYRNVLVRQSDQFVNHLYTHNNKIYKAVIGYNTTHKSITLSYKHATGTDDACKYMQAVFGPKAGGRQGIAGTPRGEEFTLDDAKELASHLVDQ